MTNTEFEQQKQRRIDDIENQLGMLDDGTMRKSLELELMLAKRRTHEQSAVDHRFITN